MEVSIPALYFRKNVLDTLAYYWNMCKAYVGTNVLNEGNYVESAKEARIGEGGQ
jgi:hypothetical protein